MFDKSKVDYSLYLCTDRNLMTSKTVEECVEQAIKGGCGIIQLREKNCSSREFYQTAKKVLEITNHYNVPLIINDRVDIALAVRADGVHLGQSDLECSVARKILGENTIIGISCQNVKLAKQAQADGADYIGVGAVFNTSTKNNTIPVSLDTLKEIRAITKIPMVVIGGVNANNIDTFKGMSIDGAAVVSAVVAQQDITKSAENLLSHIKNW